MELMEKLGTSSGLWSTVYHLGGEFKHMKEPEDVHTCGVTTYIFKRLCEY